MTNIIRNTRPTQPGPYWFHCSKCGAFDQQELDEDDISDGCHDGSLICADCFNADFANVTRADFELAFEIYDELHRPDEKPKN